MDFKRCKSLPFRLEKFAMHSIVGILIVIIAFFSPINPYLRLGFVILVVGFNVLKNEILTRSI